MRHDWRILGKGTHLRREIPPARRVGLCVERLTLDSYPAKTAVVTKLARLPYDFQPYMRFAAQCLRTAVSPYRNIAVPGGNLSL